jgi:uncharacterized protein
MPTRDRFDHGVPSWVDLTAIDVEAAKRFYGGLFAWDWTASNVPGAGAYWTARLHGQAIAGVAPQASAPSGRTNPSRWNTYINVDSLDGTLSRATGAGCEVIVAATDIGDTGRMAIVKDPSGAAIGMWQAGTFKGAGLVNDPGTMVWNEVYAPDTDVIVAFYRQVFGWDTSAIPMPGGGGYTTFKVGDATIGGTAPPSPGQEPPHWQVWFGTVDTDATAARAAELGATVLEKPTESPAGKFAFLRDPSGADFSIITAGQT